VPQACPVGQLAFERATVSDAPTEVEHDCFPSYNMKPVLGGLPLSRIRAVLVA
jgi:hypothetical protein